MRWFFVFILLGLSPHFYAQTDTLKIFTDTVNYEPSTPLDSTKNNRIDQIIGSAKKYLGVPYRYAGNSPVGFDCSGFIYYVFKKYDIDITRSSASMASYGKRVKLVDVRKGDLLYFKGSKLSSTTIGHVGMVIENENGVIKFIHSANGGVQITTFNGSKYYVPRFIMAKRLEY
jgi:cell wall-associated NlpC family hydrolase